MLSNAELEKIKTLWGIESALLGILDVLRYYVGTRVSAMRFASIE